MPELTRAVARSRDPSRAIARLCELARGVPAARARALLVIAFALASIVPLFARLGHYALWDDEAVTALGAHAVWRTGDTSARIDHNVVAYGNGRLLHGLADRSTPPLPAYLAAPLVGPSPGDAFRARVLFAAMGVLCVAWLAHVLARARADRLTWLLFGLCLFGNVSFFLYFRNCRYYAPAILCSAIVAVLYLRHDGRRGRLLCASLASIALFASNYLDYAALMVTLALDYAIFGRRARRLSAREWAIFLGPQIVACAAIFARWNTLDTVNGRLFLANDWKDRFTLLGWTVRDLDFCEYYALGLLALAPFVWAATRDRWLGRATVALATYVVFMGLMAPTPVSLRDSSDVRYLAPVIPLSIAVSVLILRGVASTRWAWATLPLALLFACTNVLHLGPLRRVGVRSTVLAFARELAHPPRDPYTVASRWIQAHVPDGASVFVLPSFMNYPLMFHAPRALYAWQLDPPPKGDLAALPPIHFRGGPPPDYIVAFGPEAMDEVAKNLAAGARADLVYEPAATLDVYWRDRFRPELVWRDFEERRGFDPERQGVRVLRRKAHDAPRK